MKLEIGNWEKYKTFQFQRYVNAFINLNPLTVQKGGEKKMKADMRIVDLLNVKRRIPDKKKVEDVMKKESDALYKKDSSLSVYDSPYDAENATFKETLESAAYVKDENKTQTEKVKNVSSKDGKCSGKQQKTEERSKWQNVIAGETAERKVSGSDTTSTKQAVAIIEEVLEAVSKKLHLNIDFTNGLSDLDLITPSEAILEQFSEIFFALQGIRQLLEQAAEHNVALDIKGVVIEPQEAAVLEQTLRLEIFRLQLAMEALGVAGEVSRAVAEKMQIPVKDAGIPLATDPSSLSMPDNQLQQLLGNLVESEEDQIASVIARIAAVAKEKSLEERLAVLIKEQNPDEKQVALKVTDVKSEKPGAPDPGTFNSQILRRLLKIDDGGQQFAGEGKPDTDAKADKPQFVNLTLDMAGKQNFQSFNQQMLNLSQSVENAEQVAGMETGIRGDSNTVDMVPKLPTMPYRTIEESVILQVSQRLSNAVKNGMHEIRLLLRPETLGNVRMTIQMEGDIVMARINVENQQVKQIIESNLQSLKDSLEEQNLQAGAFDVNVNQGSEGDAQEAASLGKNNRIAENADEVTQDGSDGKTIDAGTETGRRFGSNTVEYFA